jgi:DNA-binding NarL/FixJ family response regulator
MAGEVQKYASAGANKVYAVNTNDEFKEALKAHSPHLAIIENNCWYEATPFMVSHYSETYPLMNIAVFSYERLTPAKAAQFVNLGADSFIDLRLGESEIEKAFDTVIHNKPYIPQWVDETIDDYCLGITEYPNLQKGEIAVLRLIALGNGIDETAAKLEICNGTVRNHISNIHKKFNMHTQTELISLALRIGIVQPEELYTKEINIQILEKEVRDVHTNKERMFAY